MPTKTYPYNIAIYGSPEISAVTRTLKAGTLLSGGDQTRLFEEDLAKWWGVKYAIAVSSGSAANFIAVQALNLPPKSEVLVPAGGSFPTTISPLYYHQLIPVYLDIDLTTYCLDTALLAQAITPATRAIIVPHTLGFMPDMQLILALAQKYNLQIIEDTCDAMGSRQHGQLAGTFGNLATVSFYPAHLMTTGGEGGAILTNSQELYHTCYSIRDWGRACVCQAERLAGSAPACGRRFTLIPGHDHRYYYTKLGLNFKMTEMQAAFGRVQLNRVDQFITKRKRNYQVLANYLNMPVNPEITPFAFPLLTKNRPAVMAELQKLGIGVRTIFSGNILDHPAYRHLSHKIKGSLKNSTKLHQEGLFVGVGPHLTVKDMTYLAKSLATILAKV